MRWLYNSQPKETSWTKLYVNAKLTLWALAVMLREFNRYLFDPFCDVYGAVIDNFLDKLDAIEVLTLCV